LDSIKVCGVPEHFNLPWLLCLENNDFLDKNISLSWTNVPEGTGRMCEMLRNKETDLAVILTEGIIKDIEAGNESKIIQVFVETPLIWGIHVDAKSEFVSVSDLQNKKAAISRLGSGSQLMAFVNAKNNNWETNNLSFEIVNNIEGAVEALTNQKADYFLWEKFMTKPFVDKGVFRRVGECPTPWPCFVVAVRNDFFENNKNVVQQVLKIINKKTKQFKEIQSVQEIIAHKYQLKVNDVDQWLNQTSWSSQNLSEKVLNNIQNELLDLKLIDKKSTFADVVAHF
jgi:ABC-type nitrate/sulfonate/bicarbonate transport system substrate-binding protein